MDGKVDTEGRRQGTFCREDSCQMIRVLSLAFHYGLYSDSIRKERVD